MARFSTTNWRFATQTIVFVLLFCITFGSLSSFAFDSPRSPDLVFCPLQQQWVKKSEPAMPLAKGLLVDICASNKDKESFGGKLVQNIKISGKLTPENLFFEYQAKGDRAFAEMPSAPNPPDFPLVTLAKVQGASGVSRDDFPFAITTVLSLTQLSRPPTSRAAVDNFSLPAHPNLAIIAPAMAPRGPPVSL